MEAAAPVLMMIGIDDKGPQTNLIPASQVCITSFCIPQASTEPSLEMPKPQPLHK